LQNRIQNGLDPNYQGKLGITLLGWAVGGNHYDCIDYLLKNGADPYLMFGEDSNISSIGISIVNRDTKTLLLLLESKIDLNRVFEVTKFNELNGSIGFRNESLEFTKLLLKYGANPNKNYGDGFPLSVPFNLRNFEAALLLLNNGADPYIDKLVTETIIYVGNSVLRSEVKFDYFDEVIELLRKKGMSFEGN
jgi:ankyrin repeat protein